VDFGIAASCHPDVPLAGVPRFPVATRPIAAAPDDIAADNRDRSVARQMRRRHSMTLEVWTWQCDVDLLDDPVANKGTAFSRRR
jgi:hypothetical protein